MPHELSSNEQEAANRAEVTALLIRSGYRVYRPEADVHGEDLVLRAPPSDDLRPGDLRPVQLKGRPTVARKYGGKGIWMLFPDPKGTLGRPWFLVPHDKFFAWVEECHPATLARRDDYHYPYIKRDLAKFLEDFRIPGPQCSE
jgi:hypothetical protein